MAKNRPVTPTKRVASATPTVLGSPNVRVIPRADKRVGAKSQDGIRVTGDSIWVATITTVAQRSRESKLRWSQTDAERKQMEAKLRTKRTRQTSRAYMTATIEEIASSKKEEHQ